LKIFQHFFGKSVIDKSLRENFGLEALRPSLLKKILTLSSKKIQKLLFYNFVTRTHSQQFLLQKPMDVKLLGYTMLEGKVVIACLYS